MQFVARKLYYRIGEACEIVGVEPHVLRYWESEFPSLTPPKSKAGQRTYRPKDIELLLTIKKLLYEEGFTIAGARKQLSHGRRTGKAPDGSKEHAPADGPQAQAPGTPAQNLDRVRAELENILTLLQRE
jgi:DNA-binding transcriptional MerR regulator